jgi:energy-coupling factor transporter ATP-binding protein EcfA2
MFLKKFIFVNWGGLPNQEFELGPVNLLSGGNGSGKTTAADAIQTIMTAAHDTLFAFNPGQEETSQRGRGGKQMRTLASYVLGCDDGVYSRPWPTDGYIAAVFHPTKGETAEPFTAFIGCRALLDNAGAQRQARLQDTVYFIAMGVQLTLEHFVREFVDGKHVVAINDINGLLGHEYGKQAIEKYDSKKAYLGRFYGALRGLNGRVSDREAMSAAKAFSGFMAYKPDKKGIHHFVANEIMEKKDQGEAIRSVSGLMKNIHAMEQDARHLKASLDVLAGAKATSQKYIGSWIEWHELQYIHAKGLYLNDQKQYLSYREQYEQTQLLIVANGKERDVNERRVKEIQLEIDELNARRLGVSSLRTKDELEGQIAQARTAVSRLKLPLQQQDQVVRKNILQAESLQRLLQSSSIALAAPMIASRAVSAALKSVVELDKPQFEVDQLFVQDWIDSSGQESALDAALTFQREHNALVQLLQQRSDSGESVRDQLAAFRDRQLSEAQQLLKQLERKQHEIDALAQKQVNYPPYVVAALQAINMQCPQADARVLCDYVEVSDPRWQSAIEGYLGGARFSIIVDAEFEARSIQIVRSLPGRNNKARVIQGEKARKDYDSLRGKLPSNSILDVMSFNHKTAEYYLAASYGMVERVENVQDLRFTRRGVTAEGMGSGNYSLFRCDISDAELVFGNFAFEKAAIAKKEEMDTLALSIDGANSSYQSGKQVVDIVDAFASLQYGDLLETLVEQQAILRRAEGQLDNLELDDFSEVEAELEQVREQRNERTSQSEELAKEAGRLESRRDSLKKQVAIWADKQDGTMEKADECETLLIKIQSKHPEYDAEKRLEWAEQEAANANISVLENQLGAVIADLSEALNTIDRTVSEHNNGCLPSDNLVFHRDYQQDHRESCFLEVNRLQHAIDQIFNRLQNNILVEKYEKLKELKLSFNTTFVTNLCHSIYQSINDGQRVLEELNDELKHHRFGADQEVYRFGWDWMPEFKEYWRFFEEIIQQPQLGETIDLSELELTQKSQKVLESLVAMLLDEDEQKAYRELDRIADYRNYRQYEIYKEPLGKDPIPLSQYGTGSGGQSETPFYIIRSAAVTSAFRFKEGKSHLRMVLVDEAFSRMDETRSREVINYLTNTLGLQLLFVMPSSKSGTFLDLVTNQFVFAKCPSTEPVGELNTQVFIDRQQLNQEKVADLWSHHKNTLHNQAAFDFMEEFV